MIKNLVYEQFLPKHSFYTQDEIVNIYGQSVKRNFISSLVLKDENLFNTYKNEDKVTLTNGKSISKILIHDMLSEEGMYKYLQTNLDNYLGIAIRLDYIMDKDTFASIKITRAELIEVLNLLSSELTQKEKMRSAVIKNSLLLFSCEQRYLNHYHQCVIDDENISIPASTLIQILTMDDESFNRFLNSRISFGYKIEHLAYALVDFFERERIFIKYVLPTKVYERYQRIADYSLIDYESLNKNRIRNDINENGESIIDDIIISDELSSYLDQELEKTYSNLEKAIYYYIKLCFLFTTDPNYFLTADKSIQIQHEQIANINKKGPKDNKVIPYDFIILYAKILDNLDIDFTIDQMLFSYAKNKAKLTFRYGEYLLSVTTSSKIGENDLTNIKVNDQIINLNCINHHEITQKKFQEIVTRIYNTINKKRAVKQNFKQSLETYQSSMQKSEIPLKERIQILLKEICRVNLTGLDMLSYEKKIFSNLFSKDDQVEIRFLCCDDEQGLRPITIISVLDDNYIYFIIDQKNKDIISSVTKEELTDLLESNIIYYIEPGTIPGISEFVGEVYAR